MKRISSAEFVRSFSRHTDAALTEPVVITRNGRDRLVLLSISEYSELLAMATNKDIAPGEGIRERLRDQIEAVL